MFHIFKIAAVHKRRGWRLILQCIETFDTAPPLYMCASSLVCFLSALYIVTSMTHCLQVVPRQRIAVLLDGNDVVNHLANSIAFNTQWMLFDERGA